MGFFRATIVGGALFLVPIVVIIGVLGKALEFVHKITAPIAQAIPPDIAGGIPTPRILAVVALVLFCFLAGLFARTNLAQRLVTWLESNLLSLIPGYSYMKSMGADLAGVAERTHEVVLVRIEDSWQIGFVVERMREGQLAVFVPDAPNPWSGSVYLTTEDRIKLLDVPVASAMQCIKGLGLGSGKLTQGRL